MNRKQRRELRKDKNLINELDDREKEIIMLRYYKQKTQMQVSKILGITQVQVSRIERKVLDNMRRKLSIWKKY